MRPQTIEAVLYTSVDVSNAVDIGISVMIHGFVTFAKVPRSTDTPARVGAVAGERGGWGANLAAAQVLTGVAAAAGTGSVLVLA